MLKTLLSSLLGRFWSKSENSDLVSLTTLDFSKSVTLSQDTLTESKIQSFIPTFDGIAVSFINDQTFYNGITQGTYFTSVVNFGSLQGASNSAVFAIVHKGETFTVHRSARSSQSSAVFIVPFRGAS